MDDDDLVRMGKGSHPTGWNEKTNVRQVEKSCMVKIDSLGELPYDMYHIESAPRSSLAHPSSRTNHSEPKNNNNKEKNQLPKKNK